MDERPSLRFSITVAVVMLNLAYADLLLFGIVTSQRSVVESFRNMVFLIVPFFGIQACAGLIVLVTYWINRRDEPPHTKPPPDYPCLTSIPRPTPKVRFVRKMQHHPQARVSGFTDDLG